jgi:hypothetical protein
MMKRIVITLDDDRAAKLTVLAERMHVHPAEVARSLVSAALDEAEPDAHGVAELLDGIPGAYERAQLGVQEGHTGRTIHLDQL